MIKAAIFDLDGTLADTLPDLTEGMSRARAHFGLFPITEEDVLKFINGTTKQFIKSSFPEGMDEKYYDEAEKVYLKEYSECYLHGTRAYDNMANILALLRGAGIRLAVLTNKDDGHAKEIVKKLYGDAAFEIIIGTGRFPGKPDPTAALFIAESLFVKPSEVAYIGDSDVDIHTAKNAGMITLDVSWGYRSEEILRSVGAKYIAHTPEDILKIIGRINDAAGKGDN